MSDSCLIHLTKQLQSQKELSETEVIDAGSALMDETVSSETKSNFLLAWKKKGESSEEIGYLAKLFRTKATNPQLDSYASKAIDIVGTGGDKSGTFNISTTTAIVVASGDVPVIKHGNRSITSKTGSADLLESLGVPFTADSDQLKRALTHNNFVFLFAPAFHPAFKAIMPVRKELAEKGERTIFNILGPLINPAQPAYQLMGVFEANLVSQLSPTLTQIGIKRGLVAHSTFESQGMDEITTIGKNTISPAGELTSAEIGEIQKFASSKLSGNLSELKGGNSEENLSIFENILNYKANQTLLDTICLNAGIAFFIAENVASVEEGYNKAVGLLKNGVTKNWVQKTKAFYKNES